MAKNSTKSDPENQIDNQDENAKSGSFFSRIGQWLGSRKKKDDEPLLKNPAEITAELLSKQLSSPENKNLIFPNTSGRPDKKDSKTRRPRRRRQKRTHPSPQKKLHDAYQPRVDKQNSSDKQTEIQSDEKKVSKYTLLINTDEPEECRVALLEDGKVEAFHIETVSHTQTKGNIYKGKITAVEPGLQAAFVDIGSGKNGFLAFSDIHPEYYAKKVSPDTHWKDLSIEDVIIKGQEVLVEVVKEAAGSKGANMTTYLSLPGRYLVLMPGSDSAGISRKIDNEAQRTRLKKMINSLKWPEGIGYIVRTASLDITKKALSEDMRYLLNLWNEIKRNGQEMEAPSLIYKEQDIISQFLRDQFTTDIDEIIVDDQDAYNKVVRFLDLLPPQQRKAKAKLHKGSKPLFHQYNVEKQIEQIYQPKVPLPSGGSIVISPTEALVAIDVNSGRTTKDKSFEESIYLANLEAAEELARQLRLRDLGGLIVVDFIDMRSMQHTKAVEKKVKACMKRDRAKVDLSRISKFGLMQISRQKIASPIQHGTYKVCEHCKGRGIVRSVETLALSYLRMIQLGAIRRKTTAVECRLPAEAAHYLLDHKKDELHELEKRFRVSINIHPDPDIVPSEEKIKFIRKD